MDNPLDLKKRFPNYFHQGLFRACIVIIFFAFLYVGQTNGWRNDFAQITCPETSWDDCFISEQTLNSVGIYEYPNGILLSAGQSIGDKPNRAYELFLPFTIATVLFTFGYNHILYIRKKEE